MPLFDTEHDAETIKDLGQRYDVDSLYADPAPRGLEELIRSPGWSWAGRGPWGPFATDGVFRKGPITLDVFEAATTFILPDWPDNHPLDLFFAVVWGVPSPNLLQASIDSWTRLPLGLLVAQEDIDGSRLGLVRATTTHIDVRGYVTHAAPSGIYVVDPDDPNDLVRFWNLRSLGGDLVAVPKDGDEGIFRLLFGSPVGTHEVKRGDDTVGTPSVSVWNIERADDLASDLIRRYATERRLDMWTHGQPDRSVWFSGLRTPFRHRFRTSFRPGDLVAEVPVAALPTIQSAENMWRRGTVAVDVAIEAVEGQDPRLTIEHPPYRRIAGLVSPILQGRGIEQSRITTDGMAVCIPGNREHVEVAFSYHLAVFESLFDNEQTKVSQSTEGKFQTRAAEMLGGPFSAYLTQPGVRAAIELVARRAHGVTTQQLTNAIGDQRGQWPDPMQFRTTPEQYVRDQSLQLLNTGLLVPMMDVHCSHCRVVSQVSPRDLEDNVLCEFCGEKSRLGLSMELSKPTWRHRFASHLPVERVQALLPAHAAASVVLQVAHERGNPPHVFGLEVTTKGQRPVEVDVALYLSEPSWTVLLGEVKNRNRIDENDIQNLERLQSDLLAKDVRCVIMIATLKPELDRDEIDAVRSHVHRTSRTISMGPGGAVVPLFPLVLVGNDLSMPWGSDRHPWRWERNEFRGILGTALESCRRNLGLKEFEFTSSGFRCLWRDDA